jgi:hypothetical protein
LRTSYPKVSVVVTALKCGIRVVFILFCDMMYSRWAKCERIPG